MNENDADYFSSMNTQYPARFRAEQLLFLNLLNSDKNTNNFIDNTYSYNLELEKISELCIANNLVVIEASEIGLKSLKYPSLSKYSSNKLSFVDWQLLYKKYCDSYHHISTVNILIDRTLYMLTKVKKKVIKIYALYSKV